jgi:hypothetical protein
VAAALPIDGQPCGGERQPVAGSRGPRRPGDSQDNHADQQADEDELGRRAGPQPASGQADDRQQQRGRDGRAGEPATTGQVGDVAGADEADDRGAGHHPGEEDPAGRPARTRPQASGDVPHHPAGGPALPAQGREHGGEQAGQAQQGEPGKD